MIIIRVYECNKNREQLLFRLAGSDVYDCAEMAAFGLAKLIKQTPNIVRALYDKKEQMVFPSPFEKNTSFRLELENQDETAVI